MYKKAIILAMSAAVVLSGCQGNKALEAAQAPATETTAEVTSEATEETAESTEETKAAETETQTAEQAASISKMEAVSADGTLDDLIQAFQEDCVRAAESSGIKADHNDLVYEIDDPEMVTIDMSEGPMLIAQISPNSKMIWYAGYPNDETWFKQEMQLVLMAGDNTLTPEEAKTFADEIWDEAWDNRNNMPSAVQKTLPSGLLYTMSLTEQGLVSFQIIYL